MRIVSDLQFFMFSVSFGLISCMVRIELFTILFPQNKPSGLLLLKLKEYCEYFQAMVVK